MEKRDSQRQGRCPGGDAETPGDSDAGQEWELRASGLCDGPSRTTADCLCPRGGTRRTQADCGRRGAPSLWLCCCGGVPWTQEAKNHGTLTRLWFLTMSPASLALTVLSANVVTALFMEKSRLETELPSRSAGPGPPSHHATL